MEVLCYQGCASHLLLEISKSFHAFTANKAGYFVYCTDAVPLSPLVSFLP